MRHLIRSTAVVGMILCAWAPTAPAQTIKGVVLEDSTSLPVDAAQVSLLNERGEELAITITTRTGPTGAFALNAPRPGAYRVRAIRIGFQPATSEVIRLEFAEVVTVRLRMTVASQRLATVAVTERRRYSNPELTSTMGFELRRSQPYGIFFTGEDLARLHDVRDITYSARVGGLRMSGSIFDEQIVWSRSRRTCSPALYLDGFPVSPSILYGIPADRLYGIEVYRPTTPPPLRTAGWLGEKPLPCGLIAVWTKHQLTRDSLNGLLPGTTRAGVQVIRGVVVDDDTQKPVANLPVRLLSDEGYALSERTRSDSTGEFVIRTKRIGSFRLEMGGDSIRPTQTPVVRLAAEEVVIVRLFVSATRLVPVPLGVSARAGPRTYLLTDIRGFDYRRSRGVTGVYFDKDSISRRSPRTFAELLVGVEDVVLTGTPPADSIAMRTTLRPPADRCTPAYLKDGARIPPTRADSTIRALDMNTVVAVEVHPDPRRASVVFEDVIGACGLIGIWTGSR